MNLGIYEDSELVIGLVGAVGTDLENITRIISARLVAYRYTVDNLRISKDCIIPLCETLNIDSIPAENATFFDKVNSLMDCGNRVRQETSCNEILALACAGVIRTRRGAGEGEVAKPKSRKAYIINSLKNPDEVDTLGKIYSKSFLLIGVHCSKDKRKSYLVDNQRLEEEEADKLIDRDINENNKFGQHTQDTFHLSDFYIDYGTNSEKLEKDIWRILDLIFGKPFLTPTPDEFAMFMAFSASLRSADLSRQVGAVVARGEDIISTGANDVPKFGGGLYWPSIENSNKYEISDVPEGRDYMRGKDTNHAQKQEIIEEILSVIEDENVKNQFRDILKESPIKDITEYGRIVHAEMEALMSCTRNNQCTKNATLYCTTFPCHNCAKHIIAAGITRVVYIEPYPKSKALEFHNDSITEDERNSDTKVFFEPFVGVGPRSFYNLFSMNLGSGEPVIRKSKGKAIEWKPQFANLRMQILPNSYLELEEVAAKEVTNVIDNLEQ